jgi:hypothetical protein
MLLGGAAVALMSASLADSQSIAIRGFSGNFLNAGSAYQPYFIVDEGSLWPSKNIEVCWEALDPQGATERQWVRSAVSTYVEGNSLFRFGGPNWGVCDQDQRARVRILVADADGIASESEVGYQSPVGPTYMRMNFTFKTWNQSCAATEDRRRRCIETFAVHEFLHAVGTLHEQLSQDLKTADPACYAIYQNSPDIVGKQPVALTDYDPDSIMNYCKDITTVPTHLSVLDLVGLKKLSNFYAT